MTDQHLAPRWVTRTFTMRLDVGTYGSEPDDEEIAYLLRMGGIDAEVATDCEDLCMDKCIGACGV